MKAKKINKKIKRFTSLLLALALSFSMGMTAFAAEPTSTPEVIDETSSIKTVEPITPVYGKVSEIPEATTMAARAASGYAAHYTDSRIDSFYISVTGSSSGTGTAKIKAWDFPASTKVTVSLARPDGSLALSDIQLVIGTEISRSFSNLQTGTYRLIYTVHSANKGWIYCNIN